MKKIILVFVCVISLSAFAQDNTIDVIIDGKPAKMNVKTGAYTFTNEMSNSSETENYNASSNTTKNTVHTVSKGETLYSISKKYSISLAQIKSLNSLKSNVLSINQQLKIGYNVSSEINKNSVYVVEKGDTLYSIAKLSNLTIQQLKALNNLKSNIISIGQELTIK